MSEDDLEVVGRMLAAFNRGDVEAVIDTFDERCEIIEPIEMPEQHALGFRGHQGIRDWMANLRDTTTAEFEPRSFTEADGVWLCELMSRGLGQASGARIEWTTFAVIRIRDGKIEQVRVFLDRDQAREAVGLSE